MKLNVGTGYFIEGERPLKRRNGEGERSQKMQNPAPLAPGWIQPLASGSEAPKKGGSSDGFAESVEPWRGRS